MDLPLPNRPAFHLTLAAVLLAVVPAAWATAPMRDGGIAPEIRQAFEGGLFQLPERSATATSVAQDAWRVPVLMVSFSDDTLLYTPQDFEFALFDTTHSTPLGSAFDYYRWVSGGRFTLSGRVVALVRLPHDRLFYGGNAWGVNSSATPNNMLGALRDAIVRSDTVGTPIRWSDFDLDHDGYVDMLWLLHAGIGGESGRDRNAFWSLTSRMSGVWKNAQVYEVHEFVPGSMSQHMRIDRFSSLPELSMFRTGQRCEIGVFCHEFGHALGLPDLYDTSNFGSPGGNLGPGNWSLMSTGVYGTNGSSPELPSHLGAWAQNFMGWADLLSPADDASIVLPPIEEGGIALNFRFQGESSTEHFLIENRQRMGFDARLPSTGLIITLADEAAIGARLSANSVNAGLTPGLRVVEADGRYDLTKGVPAGGNAGDLSDPFPGASQVTAWNDETVPSTRSFSGAFTNLALSQITLSGAGVSMHTQLRAPGWLGIEDHTEAQFNPVGGGTAANTLVADTLGNLATVTAETRSGLPQILLRERLGGVWKAASVVSFSSAGADQPTLARLDNGDLLVAWRDLRDGPSHLYYRARIRGEWTLEQRILGPADYSFQPAIATDGRGQVYLAWLTSVFGQPRVKFMRFAYASPFGTPVALTDSTAYPDAPAVASSPNGRAIIAWSDRGARPQLVLFARFDPDSGVSKAFSLGIADGQPQSAVAVALEPGGKMHAIWQEIGPHEIELHYQRRTPPGGQWVPDTTLETQGGGFLSTRLVTDAQGGVHIAFETTAGGVQEVRYKHWTMDRGWDMVSMEVTRPADGSSRQPQLVALSPGDVSVLFTGYPTGQFRFMSRDRRLSGRPLLSSPAARLPAHANLFAGPNPLRAGMVVDFLWNGASSPGTPLEVFDLVGRRVASAAVDGIGTRFAARLESSTTSAWTPGLYFARVRGTTGVARLIVLR